jgi:hypothetical protein
MENERSGGTVAVTATWSFANVASAIEPVSSVVLNVDVQLPAVPVVKFTRILFDVVALVPSTPVFPETVTP